MKKHVVCLTKAYNWGDTLTWLRYYDQLGYTIHLIDNESEFDASTWFKDRPQHTYEKIEGWPDQWRLFSNILTENKYGFNKGDLVAFIDDDEYLWYYLDYWKMVESKDPQYKNKYYEPMEDYLVKQMKKQTDMGVPGCVLVPQILMSSSELMKGRDESSYIDSNYYRRTDTSSQGKAIVLYDPEYTYDFTIKVGEECGHVPVIYKESFDPSVYADTVEHAKRLSLVNGEGISETTYGDVDYNACLRLYHYHIKSENDWHKKINRGSSAVDHQWYASDVRANKYFGGYNIPDFTMLETKKLMGI